MLSLKLAGSISGVFRLGLPYMHEPALSPAPTLVSTFGSLIVRRILAQQSGISLPG